MVPKNDEEDDGVRDEGYAPVVHHALPEHCSQHDHIALPQQGSHWNGARMEERQLPIVMELSIDLPPCQAELYCVEEEQCAQHYPGSGHNGSHSPCQLALPVDGSLVVQWPLMPILPHERRYVRLQVEPEHQLQGQQQRERGHLQQQPVGREERQRIEGEEQALQAVARVQLLQEPALAQRRAHQPVPAQPCGGCFFASGHVEDAVMVVQLVAHSEAKECCVDDGPEVWVL
mmetsp:Transcript_18244/g.70505  ORF Transcript_18244/g.70505 Transcript_18244/m.70505 type:complete len:231 (+) Transcript_18244:907-1599(+)